MDTSGIDSSKLHAYQDAAAGHDGVLTDDTGAIVVKPSTMAEVAFYEDTNANHPDFAALIPTFMGTLQLGRTEQLEKALIDSANQGTLPLTDGDGAVAASITTAAKGKPITTDMAIVLENIAHGFVKPNILDVKLGSRLWDDDASLDKQQRLNKVSQQTTSSTHGFRIAGMKRFNGQSYDIFDKFYGRSLTADTVHKAFEELFDIAGDSPDTQVFTEVIHGAVEAVEEIEHQVSHQESIMYSSSLLFVYEGDRDARQAALAAMAKQQGVHLEAEAHDNDSDDDESETPKLFDVRVIDFAHARWVPGKGPDENMLRGIRSVLEILKQLSNNHIDS